MTLSASAIINGLTMLRAYNPEIRVSVGAGTIEVAGVDAESLHADDYNRLLSEGWHEGTHGSLNVWWVE